MSFFLADQPDSADVVYSMSHMLYTTLYADIVVYSMSQVSPSLRGASSLPDKPPNITA